MSAKGVCHVQKIVVKKDGDDWGSADMDFWLTVNGAEFTIGRFTDVEDVKTITINRSFEFNDNRIKIAIRFKAVDEEPHVWGMSDQVAIRDYEIDTNVDPLPRYGAYVTANQNSVKATIYFDLLPTDIVSDRDQVRFVRIHQERDAAGLMRELVDDRGRLTDTYHFWLHGEAFQLLIRDYWVSDVGFPNDAIRSVVFPGNVRLHLFKDNFEDRSWLVLEGQQGFRVNLDDFRLPDGSGSWADQVTALRTLTLVQVRN